MPHKAKPQHYSCLREVVTMAEAARLYYRSTKTVRYAIDAENLAARQCGRNWLVSVSSLIALWGNPPLRR